ncbi:hypothetical protein PoB_000937400 [Plakobranchus ocellatus]|uniref:Uncharacterized protein n=1 Tax=Plakobranchus ocellatus TaxID=259542 RepID=A0AAV3YLE9_9GAST|nr:hypothetical protein PoB_000937400 [Plakobranchus ocellatus]
MDEGQNIIIMDSILFSSLTQTMTSVKGTPYERARLFSSVIIAPLYCLLLGTSTPLSLCPSRPMQQHPIISKRFTMDSARKPWTHLGHVTLLNKPPSQQERSLCRYYVATWTPLGVPHRARTGKSSNVAGSDSGHLDSGHTGNVVNATMKAAEPLLVLTRSRPVGVHTRTPSLTCERRAWRVCNSRRRHKVRERLP